VKASDRIVVVVVVVDVVVVVVIDNQASSIRTLSKELNRYGQKLNSPCDV
jgi:hypothetical protein